MNRFWMIWCPDQGNATKKQLTRQDALAEAERLAIQHPGKVFTVLESLGAYGIPTQAPVWTYADTPSTMSQEVSENKECVPA